MFRDLTAKLTRKGQIALTFGILAVALVLGAIAPHLSFPLAVLYATASFIAIAVALRVFGPKDAKSFRLYRPQA